MVASSVLGFPRIGSSIFYYIPTFYILTYRTGANREVKKAVEAYWAGKISSDELTKVAADVKKASWSSVNSKGVDFIPR
jgi:5-methyltetrahydropteroyltriglutamate--homocysteine methyltransferase